MEEGWCHWTLGRLLDVCVFRSLDTPLCWLRNPFAPLTLFWRFPNANPWKRFCNLLNSPTPTTSLRLYLNLQALRFLSLQHLKTLPTGCPHICFVSFPSSLWKMECMQSAAFRDATLVPQALRFFFFFSPCPRSQNNPSFKKAQLYFPLSPGTHSVSLSRLSEKAKTASLA